MEAAARLVEIHPGWSFNSPFLPFRSRKGLGCAASLAPLGKLVTAFRELPHVLFTLAAKTGFSAKHLQIKA
jgi:hypothetical protein